MLGIPRRHSHFVFGVIQSGLTSLIAAAIASYPFIASGQFLGHWLVSWLIAWATMLPVVVLAAPVIRSLADLLTREGS
jgi:ABC-type glycerol-3-phosphate transport system permease component